MDKLRSPDIDISFDQAPISLGQTPSDILNRIYDQVQENLDTYFVTDKDIREHIDYIVQCNSNRAGIRLLMACMLAKVDDPSLNPCMPYTEINETGCFSGRTYDEQYLTNFISKYGLRANITSAFLTPALRNIVNPLTSTTNFSGRPEELYTKTVKVLEDVAENHVHAIDILKEIVRVLLLDKSRQEQRIESLLEDLEYVDEEFALSTEVIVKLIEQHMISKNSSRLPVLVVAAAYIAAKDGLQEVVRPLHAHNAADSQTGSLGDVEICIEGDDEVVTVYEMKDKLVSIDDIDAAVNKIRKSKNKIHNYLFITTEEIEDIVVEYANTRYTQLGGVEIAVLDCIGFLRHFLHLFHDIRVRYLDTYQELLLSEPDSAVKPELKEAFLVLRKKAESND